VLLNGYNLQLLPIVADTWGIEVQRSMILTKRNAEVDTQMGIKL